MRAEVRRQLGPLEHLAEQVAHALLVEGLACLGAEDPWRHLRPPVSLHPVRASHSETEQCLHQVWGQVHLPPVKQPVVDQGGQQYPRLQIITVGELLEGKRIKFPSVGYLNVTLKKAPRAKGASAEQLPL
jgi:hypothetical protein